MRVFLLYVLILLYACKTQSNNYYHFCDSTKFRHEVGCNLITIKITTHLSNTSIPEPFVQYLNGIFYKISKKDAGLRVIVNYSHRRYSAYYETFYLMNGYHTFNKCRYVLLSAGFQNKILNLRAFRNLYAFGDVYYNYVLLEGTELNTLSQPLGSFDITANKMGLMLA